MALEDRVSLVSVTQELYVLLGKILHAGTREGTGYVRQEVVHQLLAIDLAITFEDTETQNLLATLYRELEPSVRLVEERLLAESGEAYDPALAEAGLTETGRAAKVSGFRRALDRLLGATASDRPRWVRSVLTWGDVSLGSLGGVPGIKNVVEPLKELKQSVEALMAQEHTG